MGEAIEDFPSFPCYADGPTPSACAPDRDRASFFATPRNAVPSSIAFVTLSATKSRCASHHFASWLSDLNLGTRILFFILVG
jgi:hypothetical protein